MHKAIMFITPQSQYLNCTQTSPQMVLNLASWLIFTYTQKKLHYFEKYKRQHIEIFSKTYL